jgi:hypothetical protein
MIKKKLRSLQNKSSAVVLAKAIAHSGCQRGQTYCWARALRRAIAQFWLAMGVMAYVSALFWAGFLILNTIHLALYAERIEACIVNVA